MSNIALEMKRQRDRTWLAQFSDPTAVTVTGDLGDGTGTGYIDPYSYVQDVSASDNPYPQYTQGMVNVFRQEYWNSAEWTVQHNLGDDPVMTVWQYPQAAGFGWAPFGTSPFGGSIGTVQASTQTPTIERIDQNSFKVTWASPQSGKVVAYG